MRIFLFIGLLVSFLADIGLVEAQTTIPACNSDTLGDSICEKFDKFDTHQYATCLSAAYIEDHSMGFTKCNDNYCWYKCMTELFSIDSGSVNSDCQCTPLEPGATTTKSPNTKPPKKCYADNNDCSFYLDCLAFSAPNCTSFMNSLEYARVFCEVYNQNFTQYSLNGKSWLKAAENCFQVSMKPLMSASSNSKKKCKEQKSNVKDKKAQCYLNPGKGKPSICKLECTDWYRIFWTIKNESDVFTLAEDLSQFLRLFKGCKEISACIEDFYVPTVSYKFNFKDTSLNLNKAKPQKGDEDYDLDSVAASVADSLWSQLRLDKNKFDIFSFVEDPDKPTSSDSLSVLTWILSKEEFNSNPNSWKDSETLKLLNEVVTDIIKDGKVKLSVEVNGQTIGLSSADPCLNDLCTKTGPTIIFNSQNNTASSIYPSFISALGIALAAALAAYIFN